jgi:hypothetical protein
VENAVKEQDFVAMSEIVSLLAAAISTHDLDEAYLPYHAI